MTGINTFRDRYGMGLPEAPKKDTSSKNIFMGQKSSDTYTGNQALHTAKDTLKTGTTPIKNQSILNSTMGDKKTMGGIISEGWHFVEEFHNTNNRNFPTSGAGAQGGGKGVNTYMPKGQKPTTKDYNNQVRAKIDDDRQRRNSSIDDAANIEAGTGMTARENIIGITQGATNTNASARAQAAENHTRLLDQREQQAQQG